MFMFPRHLAEAHPFFGRFISISGRSPKSVSGFYSDGSLYPARAFDFLTMHHISR
jgi:hypothetical protein